MMLGRLGVRGRLFLAFVGISGFALIAAATAMYSFTNVRTVLDQITEQRVPVALAARDLSAEVDRIVAGTPALLSADTAPRHSEIWSKLSVEIDGLDTLLRLLWEHDVPADALASLEAVVDSLRFNLHSLNDQVGERISLADRKSKVLDGLTAEYDGTQALLGSWITNVTNDTERLRGIVSETGASADSRLAAQLELSASTRLLLSLQQVKDQATEAHLNLVEMASAEDLKRLDLLLLRARWSIGNLETLASQVGTQPKELVLTEIRTFSSAIDNDDSILNLRRRELKLIAKADEVLQENTRLSLELAGAVKSLVEGARSNIAQATAKARAVQRVGSITLVVVVILSLVSSVLIVWFYVGRNVIARLTALSDSMLAIAKGNLRVAVPSAGRDDEIGRMAEALTVFRDTAIEVEEKNLHQIEEMRRRLIDALENTSEGFAFYDAEDRLELCNTRYKELLYSGTDLDIEPGMKFEEIVRSAAENGLIADAAGRVDEWVAQRLARRHESSGPQLQQRGDGRWILINERRTSDGGVVAVYADVTELKQREAELEEMDQLKSNFLSSVSHELRTPLTSVRGFAKLIARDFERRFLPLVKEDPKLQRQASRIGDNLDIIVSEAERLTRLINDVLDISKIESGSVDWRDEDIDVTSLVNQAFSAASGQFTDNPAIAARLTVDNALPALRADRDRLIQVLVNLLNNAAKFTDEGSVELKVGCDQEGWLRFAVRDTGAGIPPEERDKVFDKFHQVTKSDTLEDKPKGTGLGLSICKQIIEHYGGRIWVESEPGVGSEFIFVLPSASRIASLTPGVPLSAAEIVAPASTEDGPKSKAPLVMAVDDDPAIRSYLSQLLSDEGYRVITAENGERALALARDDRPDLITMDLMMPGVDGKTAISEIRRDKSLHDVPIIVVSVLAERDEAGADVTLGKPIDEVHLLASMRLLLNRDWPRKDDLTPSTAEQFLVVDLPGRRTQMPPLPDGVNAVSHCTIERFEERLRDGFNGTLVLPSESIKDLDLQKILEASMVRGVVISSSEH